MMRQSPSCLVQSPKASLTAFCSVAALSASPGRPLAPTATAVQPLDASARTQVIHGALDKLNASYVYPETAKKMEAAVRERERRGEYAAITDPGALAAWLPPGEMTGRFERFDARPGGSYRLVLTYADASGAPGKATAGSDIVEARFVDIVPGVRVVQAVDFVSDDPAYAGTMTMTWAVTAVNVGTRVDSVADDVPDGISAEDHAAGLNSSLENLAAYVER